MIGMSLRGVGMSKLEDYLYYHEAGPPSITVYKGDCLEVMDYWVIEEKEFVDLVITSPPYNLGNDHHTDRVKINPYDDNMPEKDYQDWQARVLNNLDSILTNDGNIFYNHKVRIKKGVTIHPIDWIRRTELVLKQELIWIQGTPNMDACRFFPFTERIYWLAKYDTAKIENKRYKDYFTWNPVGITGGHDRQYPIQMPKTFLDVLPQAKMVLDPFCGSGTTLVAAKEMKRDAIGIEISERYCQIAVNRLKNTIVPFL